MGSSLEPWQPSGEGKLTPKQRDLLRLLGPFAQAPGPADDIDVAQTVVAFQRRIQSYKATGDLIPAAQLETELAAYMSRQLAHRAPPATAKDIGGIGFTRRRIAKVLQLLAGGAGAASGIMLTAGTAVALADKLEPAKLWAVGILVALTAVFAIVLGVASIFVAPEE